MGGLKKKNIVITFLLCLLACLVWIPLLLMVTNSFTGVDEIGERFGAVLSGTEGRVKFLFLPRFPTLKPYIELLFDSPGFFVMFWNSCRQVFPTLLGQLLVGVPAAWAFGRYKFPGKKILFTLYIILMIMPFQVTMVSSYLVLKNLNLMDSSWAIILPGMFSTFPVFIMAKCFKAIPQALMEAASMDGAGDLKIFLRVGLPLGRPGIISAMILGFLEYWNAIEQPMTFLKTQSLWPLSLYLPNISAEQVSVAFTSSLVMMAPAVLLFLWGQEYLEKGIAASGLKK